MTLKTLCYCVLLPLVASCTTQQLGQINDILQNTTVIPTEAEAAGGLKDALKQGFTNGVKVLNKADGFLGRPDYKIFLPEEAKNMEQRLRDIGMGAEVDRAIASLNRGAEMAVGEALQVFVDAVTQMTIQDALSIATGGDGKATDYLERTTTSVLKQKFQPVIQQSLDKVGALKYWTDLAKIYNKIPFVTPVETDLNTYVTGKATTALFDQVRKEESLIRKDPLSRTTELMKKVFGYADSKKQ
ncbi:MAG: DUF4197 domain-containing protein [Crocinitomicaceae bacterium]|nr:DUF4197 domain-containing protein [Crocinitomicaceae bacterium]